MKRFILSVALSALAGATATAATFTAGGGKGTSIIDANGTADYTSLAAAAADFTSFSGGSTGDWTLLIRSDLNETTQSLFGNNTNGFKVTIRPAPATSATVSFVYDGRPFDDPDASLPTYIWDGNIVVGPNLAYGNSESSLDPLAIHYMDVDNFTIDGCNTPGGTTRNLTLLTPDISTTRSLIPRYSVRFVGCENSVVKNTTIIQQTLGTSASSSAEGYVCLLYNGRFVTEGSLLYLPNNARVENCLLSAMKGVVGRGVWADITGPSSTGVDAIRDMTITNNDIEVSHRAVQFGDNAGGEISYNRIRCVQTASGQRVELIIHTGSNGVAFPFTTNIIGNQIKQVVAGATNGFDYIFGIGGVVDTNSATFNIINNMVSNVSGTAAIATSGGILGRVIALQPGTKFCTINIQHNSFSMPDIANYGPSVDDSSNRMALLSFLNVSSGANAFAGTLNFQNNIVSYRQHNASVISSAPTASVGGTLTFNNNTYYYAEAAKFAEFNGTTYNDLTAWKGAGYDADSNIENPFSPASGGKWKSETDLHFDAEPATVFKTTAVIAGITTDADKQARPAVTVTKGADEYVPSANVADWVLY